MRTFVLVLATAGCATRQVTLWDPVLLAPTAQPIPDGLVATEPQRVEEKACGDEYRGLDQLVEQARQGADGLLQITVDVQRTYTSYYGGPLTITSQCYVLRAYRVTYRAPD